MNPALVATLTLEDAVARIPDALKEKLRDRLKGNFREVVRYERKPVVVTEVDAVPVPDAVDDDESGQD